jgi:hypothetical protein
MSTRMQRGQALILIALAFVGLAAFIGLAVDAGILFTDVGHLRRAVDAASLSAANQFREGRTIAQLTASARQVLALNGMDHLSLGVAVETCGTNPGDSELCYNPPRKLVRVTADLPVYFAFLPIIGFNTVTIHANAISEAASIDIVLALDTSDSQAYDAGCGDAAEDGNNDDDAWAEINLGSGTADGVADDGCGAIPMAGSFKDDHMRDPDICNPVKQCRPFRDVQDAAVALTSRLLPPYDRMAIVTFDRNAAVRKNLNHQAFLGLTDAQYLNALTTQIMALDIYKNVLSNCPGWPPNPAGCTSTNTADGLKASGNQFGLFKREEAVWIVILLSDGGANAATDTLGAWICPGGAGAANWVEPFCRDPIAGTRHISTDAAYDPDDAARDLGDWVGCLDSNTPASEQYGGCAALAPTYGQGAVIFTIGLGSQVTNNKSCDNPVWGGLVADGGLCEPNTGEQLLRYIANVGDDGDPRPSSDPCTSTGVGADCGNYYYSPTGSGLLEVFEAIASRIFTRITH